MSKNIYKMDVECDNTYEAVTTFLTLYTTTNNLLSNGQKIRPALVKVLTYYVMKGFSKKTKELIIKSNPKMNVKNLNQINSELLKKGYLIRDRYQNSLKHLSAPLKEIKKYLDENESPYLMLINLNKSV